MTQLFVGAASSCDEKFALSLSLSKSREWGTDTTGRSHFSRTKDGAPTFFDIE
ncbi:hypothetical protein MYX76_00165 [Desulfobacterota bacterium AH_259_B03_O07]|nr:hypothetical protein [Desulfobacterota bacterium AH_259_B03_O07]